MRQIKAKKILPEKLKMLNEFLQLEQDRRWKLEPTNGRVINNGKIKVNMEYFVF